VCGSDSLGGINVGVIEVEKRKVEINMKDDNDNIE
jgi:hypothetical protein